MWVRPTDDPSRAVVRDPRTKQILPPEGKEVGDHDIHWHRALQRGDVLQGKAPALAPAQTDGDVPDAEAFHSHSAASIPSTEETHEVEAVHGDSPETFL